MADYEKPAAPLPSIVPLLVDKNEASLKALLGDLADTEPHPIVAHHGKEAQLLIGDPNVKIVAAFINPNIGAAGLLSLIRFIRFHRPVLPIFVINDASLVLTHEELKQLGIEKTIDPPKSYAELKKVVAPMMQGFRFEDAARIAKKNTDQVNTQISAEDTHFVKIRAEDFLIGTKSYFDVYIRLNSGRFLKLVQANDVFPAERVSEYMSKGVTHFYLRKEAQEFYLKFCEKIAETLLSRKDVPIQLKISQTLNHGDEVLSFLRENGMDETSLRFAGNFIVNVKRLVDELKPGKYPILKGFLNDLASYDHGVATSMIASLLIRSMNMTSSEPTQTVGLASLLHDIGLFQFQIDPFMQEDEMNEEQKMKYYAHPIEGSQALIHVSGLQPVVLQAIAQHHERRNKKGFPNKIGAGSMSMVSDIVGISDEFCATMDRVKKNPKLDLAKEVEEKILQNFPGSLTNEFRRVFFFV